MRKGKMEEIDLFVGSKIGSFKHVKYFTDVSRNTKRCVKNLVDVRELRKHDSIVCMEWGNREQSEILLGKEDGLILVYNTENSCIKTHLADFGTGRIVGLGRFQEQLVGALSNGDVKVWNPDRKLVVSVGEKIERMRVYGDNLIAVGGEQNDLKIWNMDVPMIVFSGKNLPHDWLQLRRPVSVSDLCFLDADTVAVCSRHGYVRLYDTRAQNRPVTNLETSMAATCITPAQNEQQLLVGFGRGQLHLVDIRVGRLDKGYKGATGAISAVGRAGNLIFSAGLDRQLRVHNYQTKELVYKRFMASKVSGLLVQTKNRTPLDLFVEFEDEIGDRALITGSMDEIFNVMKTVRENDIPFGPPPPRRSKRQKAPTASTSSAGDEEAIKNLLKKTEKQKKKILMKKKGKKAKSVFHNA